MLKVYSVINTKSYRGTWKTEPNFATDRNSHINQLLELIVLLCSVIVQQHTVKCTIQCREFCYSTYPPQMWPQGDYGGFNFESVKTENFTLTGSCLPIKTKSSHSKVVSRPTCSKFSVVTDMLKSAVC